MKMSTKPRDPKRLLQYLDSYFGIRNNIKGDPKENINFSLETLTYMTSHNRADQITDVIVNRMKQIGSTNFGLFEVCAGIGGNTMSFLDNPAVQWVVSYELRPERREMLKRNINMYNLAVNNRSFVPNEGFTGVPANYKGVVLYFDPPWLPDHIKGHESTKDQYILHGMKIGDKTLEQWIAASPHSAMVVVRVPPGYRLGEVPGWDIDTQLLKNSLVIFATPKTNRVKAVTTQPIKSVVTERSQPGTTQPTQHNLPIGVSENERGWYEGLRNYLKKTLTIIIPSAPHREYMVNEEAMKIWVTCFTHESFNPNVGMNYEELELVGDHSMEFNFVKYMYLTMPKITRSELSELKSKYISKVFQAQVGAKMGLDKWIRTRVEINTHVNEDLLESFFGGLDTVGDKVFKFGAGAGLAYNMILKIFEDTPIDRNLGKRGHPKTQMKETFEKLHWGVPVETFQEGSMYGDVRATISFTPEAMSSLATLGVKIKSRTLASESGSSKKVAFDNAYKVALNRVRELGITDEWVEKYRGNKDMNNPELVPYLPAVQNRLKQEGYTTFYFKKAQTTKQGKYIQLIGVRPNKHLEVLAMTRGPAETELEGKRQVLEIYSSGS